MKSTLLVIICVLSILFLVSCSSTTVADNQNTNEQKNVGANKNYVGQNSKVYNNARF